MLSFLWTTDCPGGSFDDSSIPMPNLSIDTSNGPVSCEGSLSVADSYSAVASCSSNIEIIDTTAPSISCPENITIECDESKDPSYTGMATATDVCDSSPIINSSDSITPGSCPSQYTITRTWTATDASGNFDQCNQTIEVVDTTPPEISVSVSPDELWPPNHKMVVISPAITAADNCDPSPLIELQSITTNEGDETNTYEPNYDDTQGDGHTVDDIQVDGNGTISLRAERSGNGNGRIYTITYAATDACGNSSLASATVEVPHNK
jgi:hypothetical protein